MTTTETHRAVSYKTFQTYTDEIKMALLARKVSEAFEERPLPPFLPLPGLLGVTFIVP